MTRKQNIVLMGLCLPFMFVSASLFAGGAQEDQVVRIVAAHNQTSPGNPYQVGMLKFKEVAEELSNGSIMVDVHAGTLGTSEPEMLEKMEMGALDVMVSSPGFMTQVGIEEIDLFALPYLFDSVEHWERVVSGEVGEKIADIINEESGNKFKLLGFWSAGIRSYYGKQPLNSVNDIRGMTIRTQTSGVQGRFWRDIGAIPTSVAWGELYQALQQGVVDAAENAYPFFVAQSHHVATNGRYITETEHDFTTPLLFISVSSYNALSDEHKEIIEQAAKASEEAERNAVWEQMEEFKQKAINDGAQVNRIDKAPFVQAAIPIQDEWASRMGMTDILQEIRALR